MEVIRLQQIWNEVILKERQTVSCMIMYLGNSQVNKR
jgi:hypothetical protein